MSCLWHCTITYHIDEPLQSHKRIVQLQWFTNWRFILYFTFLSKLCLLVALVLIVVRSIYVGQLVRV